MFFIIYCVESVWKVVFHKIISDRSTDSLVWVSML